VTLYEIRSGYENEAYTDISRRDAKAGRIFGD
jgi:vacuolar-type H+-ATPase subunit B/Vma2